MIRGAHIEMVGYGLIRKTDYKMYENLPTEGGGGGGGVVRGWWGGGGGGASASQPLPLHAMMYIVTIMMHVINIAEFTC